MHWKHLIAGLLTAAPGLALAAGPDIANTYGTPNGNAQGRMPATVILCPSTDGSVTGIACVFGGGSAGGVMGAVNVSQINGTTISLGQTTKSASLPVTIASDQALLLGAGSALIGAVNLDIGGAANASGNPFFAQITAGTATIGAVTGPSGAALATSALQPPLTTPGTLGASGLSATVTGNLGGYTGTATATPTVSTTAYTAGMAMGGLLTLSGVSRTGQLSGLVQKALVSFADTQTPTLDVFLFNANPTASTLTDHTAFALAGADVGKVAGVMHVSDCSAAGTPTVCQAQQQALPYVLGTAGGAIYAVVVTRAAATLASTADMTVLLGGPQD